MSNRITIQRPDLTPEELAKRMEEIKLATARLVLATEKSKIRKERKA
jgi:hypothetical protein